LRKRIHRLLGVQHEVKLPQCSDLFGRKGLSFLEKLELPAPARLLLAQQLTLLKELALRIREDEKALAGLLQESPALHYMRSLPGMGPILAAVVVSEIDGIERFPSAQKLCGYAGLCPSTHSSGGKPFTANYYDVATNGSAGPSSRPPGLPSVARPTSGTSTNASEGLARSPASPS
jgi:transposase